MHPTRFFCSGLFPYLFRSPAPVSKVYPTVIAVFTESPTMKSTQVLFASRMQIIIFLGDHLGILDTESTLLLSRIVNDYHTLPFEADQESQVIRGADARTFFVLAHCVDKLSAAPPVNPQALLG